MARAFTLNNAVDSNEGVTLDKYDILLDNQSTISIFSDFDIVSNVSKAIEPITINGISGSLEVNQIANAGSFGTVYFHQDAVANIVSLAAIIDTHGRDVVRYDSENDLFVVHFPNSKTYVFERKGRLYVCNVAYVFNPMDSVHHPENNESDYYGKTSLVTTIRDNEMNFSKREVANAKKTKELKRLLGYPSDADLLDLIKTGIKDAPIDESDVRRANQIYGKGLAEVKGKNTVEKPPAVKIDHIPKPMISALQNVDIMFVESLPFLISVSKPLSYTMIDRLPSRTISSVTKTLQNQINKYHLQNFKIDTILSDNEGAIAAMHDILTARKIKFINPSGPGEHVPVVERKIRQVKERVRAHIHSLPFRLSASLLTWLIYFVCSRINMLRS
jgi:hypothetical protein